jgi:site-specific DNA recombinase
MQSLLQDGAGAQDVILYGRVSTDDQAEAGTIENQQAFLRNYVGLYGHRVIGEFWDPGVSGTVPLDQRAQGRALLSLAKTRRGAVVLLYRLDRLGRNLVALLDAHDELERAGVTIRSATEPFDTSSPIGTFLFQLLASLAELERKTIAERTMQGRDRVARAGKWTGGPIPLGYDQGPDGCLVPSQRPVPALCTPDRPVTEADLAREIFRRVAEGSSALAEAKRLNALNVPCARRYGGPKNAVVTAGGTWEPSRLRYMLKNPLYATGVHRLRARDGAVERPVPPLITEATWRRALAQLATNRKMTAREGERRYLLRGLVHCAACAALGRSSAYVGNTQTADGREYPYYRCDSAASGRGRCGAKAYNARALEAQVWDWCARFVRDPGDAIEQARAEWRASNPASVDLSAEIAHRERLLAGKQQERRRVRESHRRGSISAAEQDQDLAEIQAEADAIGQEIAELRAKEAMALAADDYFAAAEATLAAAQAEVDEIERTDDWAGKRRIVQWLVRRVEVRTEVVDGRREARARARFWFPQRCADLAFCGQEEHPTACCSKQGRKS